MVCAASKASDQPAHVHWNDISLAGRRLPNIECCLGSFVIFQGIWTSIAKKPFIFVIFQGGGGDLDPCPPSGSAHDRLVWVYTCQIATLSEISCHGSFKYFGCKISSTWTQCVSLSSLSILQETWSVSIIMCGSRGGRGQGIRTSPEIHKNIGFLSNTSPDSL